MFKITVVVELFHVAIICKSGAGLQLPSLCPDSLLWMRSYLKGGGVPLRLNVLSSQKTEVDGQVVPLPSPLSEKETDIK